MRVADCHPDRKHYAKGRCKPCWQTAWNREHPDRNSGNGYRRSHPEADLRYKRSHALARHGLSIADYEAMWRAQEGRCANPGCRVERDLIVPDYRNGLQVDHDHATGHVRALLCRYCNTALGHAQDDAERLRGLIEYLARNF